MRAFATCVCLLVASSCLGASKPPPPSKAPASQPPHQQAGAEASEPNALTGARGSSLPAPAASIAKEIKPNSGGKATDTDQKSAQNWGTNSEFLIMLLTGGALLVGVYQVFMFRVQLREMRDQLEVARRSAEIAEQAMLAADRPWIHPSVSGPSIDLHRFAAFGPNEQTRLVMFMPEISLLNYGKSPAMIESYFVKHMDSGPTVRYGELHHVLMPGERIAIRPGDTGGHLAVTEGNRRDWRSNLPSFVARFKYRTQYGKLKEVGFSFALTSLNGAWQRQGGPTLNYDKDAEEDQAPYTSPQPRLGVGAT